MEFLSDYDYEILRCPTCDGKLAPIEQYSMDGTGRIDLLGASCFNCNEHFHIPELKDILRQKRGKGPVSAP
ncbi:unnamed protein product [marine sediment metagenome]|uniref:Uncharacterized protein n=1 Tax=marine sediment metagenome TaxID=412755 RepID=X1DV91_9ZZZZ